MTPQHDFFEVLRAQRAHRAFTEERIDDDVIDRVIWAATRAPSAENLQPWFFVVVRDESRRKTIGSVMQRAWEEGGRAYAAHHLAAPLLADVDAGARGGVAAAPALIVICADTRMLHPRTIGPSIFPAVQNLLLAATALGLGSALTTLALTHGDEISRVLDLPEMVVPQAVVPIGWPARKLGESKRRPVGDVTYREKFGQPW